MNKSKKIIIGVIIALLIIVIGIVVAYKLIESSVTNREDFKFNVENISSNPVDTENLDENEYSFGKVIESNEKRIIVEPNENEEIRKSADKISIGLGENNDYSYAVGTNVKITYNNVVMETYPAQIEAIDIELKSAENFEIRFEDKSYESIAKVRTILDEKEADKYNYNIYAYMGEVNILIDGKEMPLRDALLKNKITMDEIIAKANQDFPNAVSYDDGGSIEYHYDNYTIIKCHTLDGNRDVYIGTKDLKLKDIK